MQPTTVDFSARYRVGSAGVAWYLVGYATEWTEPEWEFIGDPDDPSDDPNNWAYSESEEIEDPTRVVAIMVGDDREFTFDVDELELIDTDSYCPECGQIGCTANKG